MNAELEKRCERARALRGEDARAGIWLRVELGKVMRGLRDRLISGVRVEELVEELVEEFGFGKSSLYDFEHLASTIGDDELGEYAAALDKSGKPFRISHALLLAKLETRAQREKAFAAARTASFARLWRDVSAVALAHGYTATTTRNKSSGGSTTGRTNAKVTASRSVTPRPRKPEAPSELAASTYEFVQAIDVAAEVVRDEVKAIDHIRECVDTETPGEPLLDDLRVSYARIRALEVEASNLRARTRQLLHDLHGWRDELDSRDLARVDATPDTPNAGPHERGGREHPNSGREGGAPPEPADPGE